MRYWIEGLLLGMAWITVWALPITRDELVDTEPPLPQTERFLQLQSQLQLDYEHLRRLSWLDSLPGLLLEAVGSPSRVAVGVPESSPRESAIAFEQRLADEVSRLGSQRADVGVFVIGEHGSPPPVPTWRTNHLEYYVGMAHDRPYCLLVRISSFANFARAPLWGLPRSQVLGSCEYLVRYGMPGPRIAEWLKHGSFARGTESALEPKNFAEYLKMVRRGLESPSRRAISVAGQSCMRGSLPSCERAFLDPVGLQDPVAAQLASAIPELWSMVEFERPGSHFQGIEQLMFTDLEREFGEERFRQFWTSDQDVVAAFQSAFRVSPGVWVLAWARRYYATDLSVLEATIGNWGATVAAVLASLLAVSMIARRRSVA